MGCVMRRQSVDHALPSNGRASAAVHVGRAWCTDAKAAGVQAFKGFPAWHEVYGKALV